MTTLIPKVDLKNGTSVPVGAINRPINEKLAEWVSVKDFGATGDGTTDDTVALQNAINYAAANGFYLTVPYGTYKITSTLDLKAKQVSIYGQGYQDKSPSIFGNFDGYLMDFSGNAPSTYYEPYYINGLKLVNANNGSALNSSGCLKLLYTGRVKVENCFIQAQGTCIYMLETISAAFNDTFLVGDSGTNPNPYSRGYSGGGRNCHVNGGRAYGFYIAYDIGGDSWVLNENNCEFNTIIIRTGPVTGLLVSGCHFESSGMVWTNAATLPTTTTSPWTDNGGNGYGWSGGITFLNTLVAFGAVGSPNGVAAPVFVNKTQSGYTGQLNLIGVSFAVGTSALATISASFDRTVATSLLSGTKVFIAGTTNFVAPATIPIDSYTSYTDLDANILMSGISKLQFTDSSAYIDLSNGTAIYGYTAVSLLSIYNGNGVQYNNGQFIPTVDNVISLGNGSKRYTTVYATTGTINTSDASQKQQIRDLNQAEKDAAIGIKKALKTFKFNDSVKEKGDKARIHIGVIAQEVKQIFETVGLNADDYGLFCSDTWYVLDGKTQDEKGFPYTSETPGAIEVTQLGVRYEELLAFVISAL